MQQSRLQAILFDELVSKAVRHACNVISNDSFLGLTFVRSIGQRDPFIVLLEEMKQALDHRLCLTTHLLNSGMLIKMCS